MKRKIYEKKLQILISQQFTEIENGSDSLILKIEKDTKNTLLEMKKQKLISDNVYSKLRTIGAQPTRLYALA